MLIYWQTVKNWNCNSVANVSSGIMISMITNVVILLLQNDVSSSHYANDQMYNHVMIPNLNQLVYRAMVVYRVCTRLLTITLV